MLLAGDIGGTKTLLGLYKPETGVRQPITQAEFPSAKYPGLEEIVREFLAQINQTVAYACFDVAGPVIGGRAHLTNLPWSLSEEELRRDLGLKGVAQYGHVSYERVCSGQGLPNVYDFLRDTGYAQEPPEFAAKLAAAPDRTPLIVAAALEDPGANPLGAATLDIVVSILGTEAGNLALKVLATGGVYLAGGIPKRILPHLEDGQFMRAFASKGRFTDLLNNIPVHAVVSRVALVGAAQYGLDHLLPA